VTSEGGGEGLNEEGKPYPLRKKKGKKEQGQHEVRRLVYAVVNFLGNLTKGREGMGKGNLKKRKEISEEWPGNKF